MTGFIEVRSGDIKRLLNISHIREARPYPGEPARSLLLLPDNSENVGDTTYYRSWAAVDHSYDDLVQLILKTDCAAVAR